MFTGIKNFYVRNFFFIRDSFISLFLLLDFLIIILDGFLLFLILVIRVILYIVLNVNLYQINIRQNRFEKKNIHIFYSFFQNVLDPIPPILRNISSMIDCQISSLIVHKFYQIFEGLFRTFLPDFKCFFIVRVKKIWSNFHSI